MAAAIIDTSAELALLHEKVDRLTALLELQEQRRQEFKELEQDLIPIANHAIKLSIDELAEIGTEFRLEDLLYLLKRLLRSTPTLLKLLDQVEALSELQHEMSILGKQVFHTTAGELDRLEREGYFAFARSTMYILEQIVSEFNEEDVRALGDNVVLILKTVRNMTQPEIMALANNAVDAIRQDGAGPEKASVLALVKELADPRTRRGLARLLNIVKTFADEPESPSNN